MLNGSSLIVSFPSAEIMAGVTKIVCWVFTFNESTSNTISTCTFLSADETLHKAVFIASEYGVPAAKLAQTDMADNKFNIFNPFFIFS